MTVTARYIAWLHSIKPTARQHLGLAAMETAILLAWAILLDAIIRLVTDAFLGALPVLYTMVAILLAWLEDARVSSPADPLTAKGLAEVDRRGRMPSRWRTLVRVLLTGPSFILLLAGFWPVFRGGRSLPEVAAGVKLVPLDPALDPRPLGEIMTHRARNRKTVLAYTILSLVMAAALVVVHMPHAPLLARQDSRADAGMTQQDRQLLAGYLELSAMFPDSLEFHVRLASLYYRNGMGADLARELCEVERLDPGNPILLLREDLDEALEETLQPLDSLPEPGPLGFGRPPSVTLDSLDSDSAGAPPDSLALPGSDGTATPAPAPTPEEPVGEPTPEQAAGPPVEG